jgi:hypothetical protein
VKEDLLIIVYAPPLTAGDGRALAAVHGLERAFPGVQLAWWLARGGRPIALTQRDKWVSEAAAHGSFPLLCNGDESYLVTMRAHAFSGDIEAGRHPVTQIHANIPLDTAGIAAAEGVLAAMGDGSQAWWGLGSLLKSGAEIAQQTIQPGFPHVPPRGLPLLQQPSEIPSPLIPQRLGWLNYWSEAAAAATGLSDPARDADMFARVRRTPAGAWVLRLTEEPLDLNIPAHLDALRRAYDRFPAIGGRSTLV